MQKLKEIAFEIGLSVSEYYDITPAELTFKVEVYNRKQQQRYDEVVTMSYLSAYYNRIKKMPKLSEVLSKKEEKEIPKQQSPETLLEKLKLLNAQMGGDVY